MTEKGVTFPATSSRFPLVRNFLYIPSLIMEIPLLTAAVI